MSTIQETSISIKITYLIRNFLSRPLFKLLNGNLGRTLDIGGGSFYKNLSNSTWSNYVALEPDLSSLPKPNRLAKIISISADAGKSPIKSSTFDTVIKFKFCSLFLNLQKLLLRPIVFSEKMED